MSPREVLADKNISYRLCALLDNAGHQIVSLALMIVNLLAAFPGQHAARLPVNQILRAE